MRGKLETENDGYDYLRITPAGAGKTAEHLSGQQVLRDHPRRCGENKPHAVGIIGQPGSPPQVRGKLVSPKDKTPFLRITPAGAGKTVRFRTQYRSNRDHPRRCGENKGQGIRWLIFVGSPPQVRGKLPEFGGNATIDRITPAGAGKTAAQSLPEPTWRDHPRRCGENGRGDTA